MRFPCARLVKGGSRCRHPNTHHRTHLAGGRCPGWWLWMGSTKGPVVALLSFTLLLFDHPDNTPSSPKRRIPSQHKKEDLTDNSSGALILGDRGTESPTDHHNTTPNELHRPHRSHCQKRKNRRSRPLQNRRPRLGPGWLQLQRQDVLAPQVRRQQSLH
jgi:hypothetical protein